MVRILRLLSTLFLIVALTSYPGTKIRAEYRFSVPPQLRPRVNFWKDIFTRYGKYDVVVHHRLFPQIVFDVVDMSIEGTFLSPGQFEKLKKVRVDRSIKYLKQALERLASGESPRSNLEKRVEREMSKYLGSGSNKYARVLKEDLIRTQTGIREKFGDSIQRSGRYMSKMEEIFRKADLPVELTRLPFIESSFDYTAYSSVGAAGIWQFMRRTAKSYMLVNGIVDQRRDPIVATMGAAQYLRAAYDQLKKWPEAITSYNHGVAGVRRKVNAAGVNSIIDLIEHPTKNTFGFASSNFYPEFLAAVEVYRERERYFPDIQPEAPEKYVERRLPKSMSVRAAAAYYGVDLESLQAVNYAYSKGVWSGYTRIPKGYLIKLPVGKVPESRIKQVQGYSSVYGGPVVHLVRRGETLSSIARHYNTTVSRLMKDNRLRSSAISVGQQITIEGATKTQSTAVKRATNSTQPSQTSTYVVRAGDSLSGIAARFKTTVRSLQSLNQLKSTRIFLGQKLKVPGGSSSVGGKAAAQNVVYRVAAGDSLWEISRKFRVPVSDIMRRNGLKSKTVRVGQRLHIR